MSVALKKFSSSEVGSQILDVTPAMASEWLRDAHQNRKVRTTFVSRLAEAMRAGEWRSNGQPLIFSDAGRLLDGQHRLLAVVESGETVRFLIVRGVPEAAMVTIDRGTKRSFSDFLEIHGYSAGRLVSAAVRFAMSIEDGTYFADWTHYSYEKMQAWLDVNPRIVDSVAKYRSISRGMIVGSIASALHYLMSRKDPKQATQFWDRVIIGEGITKSDVEFKLRERLLDELRGTSRMVIERERVALCIKAWNIRRAGAPCERLLFRMDAKYPEAFPTIN